MGDNGKPVDPGPTPDEGGSAPDLPSVVAGAVNALAPHITAQQAYELTAYALAEEQALQQVFKDIIDPAKRTQYPFWGYIVKRMEDSWQGSTTVPKDPTTITTPEQAVHYSTAISFLTSPVARAVLRANGYQLSFFQAPAPAPDKPKIVLAG